MYVYNVVNITIDNVVIKNDTETVAVMMHADEPSALTINHSSITSGHMA